MSSPLANHPLKNSLIIPNWSAPKHIIAFSTVRTGGVSLAPYNSLNLGLHVSDNDQHVQVNRMRLPYAETLTWLDQTHSDEVRYCSQVSDVCLQADGAWSDQSQVGCCVLTADCLPVLMTNQAGTFVAAIHCGWRGLAKGILENALRQIQQPAEDVIVWLGPCIGVDAFEVGNDVLMHFSKSEQHGFKPSKVKPNKWFGNLHLLARLKLEQLGVTQIFDSPCCTYSQPDRFFSYRRDGQTGRMATCILINK